MASFDEVITQQEGCFARKRKRDPSKWRKNKEKARRCGSDGSRPKVSCKHNDGRCEAKLLLQNDIVRFHSLFYSDGITKVEQDTFITNNISANKTERNRSNEGKRERQFSITYFVQSAEGTKLKVCCATFCSILRIDPKRVQRLAAYQFKHGIPRGERRGGKRENKRVDHTKELIHEHIQSFKCTCGHYGREKVRLTILNLLFLHNFINRPTLLNYNITL